MAMGAIDAYADSEVRVQSLWWEYRGNEMAMYPDGIRTASGRPVVAAKGVKFLRMEPGTAVFAVSSGTYVLSD